MNPTRVYMCVAVFCATAVSGGFVQDLRARGLELGGGFTAHLDTVPTAENATLFQRHALRVDYRGIGVRFGMAEDIDALKVGLYYDEGRGKKNKISELLVPALLGYKTTALAVLSITGIGLLVLKSLALAKMALVISAATLISKLFAKKHGHHSNVEHEHHASELHPVYAEYPGDISELGYTQTSSGNFVPYSANIHDTNEINSAASAVQYAYADAPINNLTTTQTLQRRGDADKKPKPLQTLITVRRKSVLH